MMGGSQTGRFAKRPYTVWWWRRVVDGVVNGWHACSGRVVASFVDGSRVHDGWVPDRAFHETPLHGLAVMPRDKRYGAVASDRVRRGTSMGGWSMRRVGRNLGSEDREGGQGVSRNAPTRSGGEAA